MNLKETSVIRVRLSNLEADYRLLKVVCESLDTRIKDIEASQARINETLERAYDGRRAGRSNSKSGAAS